MTNSTKTAISMEVAERLKADFLAADFIKTSTEDIFRLNYNGKRYYAVMRDGRLVRGASVTNILKITMPTPFGIMDWRAKLGDRADAVLEDAANYGTMMHKIFGNIILGGKWDQGVEAVTHYIWDFILNGSTAMAPPLDIKAWVKRIQEDVFGFIVWCQKYEPRPIAVEFPFVSENQGYPYGGSIDLIAEITLGVAKKKSREIVLLDYKSSRNDPYENYFIQTHGAYRPGWNEANPDTPVSRSFIYHPRGYKLPLGKTVKPYGFQEVTEEPACKKWGKLLELYYINGIGSIEPYQIFSAGLVTRDSKPEDMVVMIDPLAKMNIKTEEPNAKGKNKTR
jgi:hypothetical protein